MIGTQAAHGYYHPDFIPVQPLETLIAPELQEVRKHRRNWLVIAGIMVVLVGVLAVQYKPLYGWVQGLRSRRMAAKAEAEILAGNFDEAFRKANTAYMTKPDQPETIRVAAKVQRLMGQGGTAVPIWKQLRQANAMRPEDRRMYAEDLLLSGSVGDAGNEIEGMLKDNSSDGALFRLAARWAAVEGNAEKARDFAAKAVQTDPANPEGRLLQALLQVAAGKEPLRDAGIRTMLELGKENVREGLEALRQLGTMRGLAADVAAKVVPLLEQHPLATEQHRILAFNLDLDLHPAERAAKLDAAVRKYRKAAPGARCAFAMWLNAHGEFERNLVLIPVDEAFKRQDMLLLCLDSLAALGRWGEVERVLEMKDVPLYTAIKELYLARSAEELGSRTVADLHWQRAHLAAVASPEQMREIAIYAEKCGRPDRAEISYRTLSANSNTARMAMEGLLKIARNRGDMDMICDTLEKMGARWPHDDAAKNDLAYFNLLRRKAVDESLAVAKQLVTRSPRSLPHLTTLALAAMRKNDPAGALSVYEGLQIPWERISTSQRAVHAAVLGANGRTAEAAAEVAALRWEELHPEERELVKQWRTQ
ncbi:MAG: hypothetical protein ABIP20_05695 [Chthoniobacteraceae bacterium]